MNRNSSSAEFDGPGSTDNGLLEGIRARDEEVWSRFAAEYSPVVYTWCRQCDLQPADALDVSQQVFQAVNRSIESFSLKTGQGSFRGWIWTITRNLVRNHLTRSLSGPRARGGSSIQMRLMQHPESVDESSLSSICASDSSQSMLTAIEALQADFDERTWQCFWLMAVEGNSAAEIAKRFKMKPAAVRQAKYRVAQRLRRELEDLA